MTDQANSHTAITLSSDGDQLLCTGSWTIVEVGDLTAALKSLSSHIKAVSEVDVGGIEHMDSAGALLLNDVLDRLRQGGQIVSVLRLKTQFQTLFSDWVHSVVFTPNTLIVPAVCLRNIRIERNKVVLPQPLLPIIAIISPRLTVIFRPSCTQ